MNLSAPATFAPSSTRLGWIGLGVMGSSMCGRLLDAGWPMTIFTRTAAKAEPLRQRGAAWADSPADVAAQCDVVFSLVGRPEDVREVHLGPRGTLASSHGAAVLVDMTSSDPALAREIAAVADERGTVALDAPVSGGDVGARKGTLSIMIGGDRPTCDALAPCWQTLGKTIVWQGPAGAGQLAKIVNQILVAAGMVGVCEALLFARQAGLDLTAVLESVSSGAAGSWTLSNLAPRMLRGDFAPGFFVEHLQKDLGLALSEAARLKLDLPGVELADELYRRAAAGGLARAGTQALIVALARAAGVEWPAEAPRQDDVG